MMKTARDRVFSEESQVCEWSTELKEFLRNYRAMPVETKGEHSGTTFFVVSIKSKLLKLIKRRTDVEMRKYDRTTKVR